MNCEAMLRDRGCTDVRADVRDPAKPVVTSRECDVYVHAEDRVGVKFARQVMERAREAGQELTVVVSVEGATPFTRKECGDAIQFFQARDLCVNVTRHELVPKHDVVDAEPHDPAHLPKMLSSDPVAQWYHWKAGTVVRVWRNFGGHEPVPYLRVVVPG